MPDAGVAELFHESMASLASGVAVIAARRGDGEPCGLVATSVASFSARPPSVLVSIDHRSRCHGALVACAHFGVHVLGTASEQLARTFAGRGENKFANHDWSWDGDVPHLRGTLSYLRCRRAENFERYDHTILIGDLLAGDLAGGEPLLYAHRRMDWLLSEPG